MTGMNLNFLKGNKTNLLILAVLCLFQLACKNKKVDETSVDFITDTSGQVDFGKTDESAYTPAIRENMKKLYEDKFGMFVHWGPYAQLEGMWKGKRVMALAVRVF